MYICLMKTTTTARHQILNLLAEHHSLRPIHILRVTTISRQRIHQILKLLVQEGVAVKKGRTPLTYYTLATGGEANSDQLIDVNQAEREILYRDFMIVKKDGRRVKGERAVCDFAREFNADPTDIAKKFLQLRLKQMVARGLDFDSSEVENSSGSSEAQETTASMDKDDRKEVKESTSNSQVSSSDQPAQGSDSYFEEIESEIPVTEQHENKGAPTNKTDLITRGQDENISIQAYDFVDFNSVGEMTNTVVSQKLQIAKKSQDRLLQLELFRETEQHIHEFITEHGIDAVAFVPGSTRAGIEFMAHWRKALDLPLPHVRLVRTADEKLLPKNSINLDTDQKAYNSYSVEVDDHRSHQHILIIDDEVISGRTARAVASNMIKAEIAEQLSIFSLVYGGSFEQMNS